MGPKLVYILPLFKSIMNEQCYIEYGKPVKSVEFNGKSVVMDEDTFRKNATIMQNCRVFVVFMHEKEKEKESHKSGVYMNCEIHYIDRKAVRIIIQSLYNDVGDIYCMSDMSLYKHIVQKYIFDEILVSIFEKQDYGSKSHYENEHAECEETLEKLDPTILSADYELNLESNKGGMICLKYIHSNTKQDDEGNGEFQYIALVKDILHNGNSRQDRTKVGTLSTFGKQLKFDISRYIPFLTTKKLAWKSVIKELLWFLSGSTDSKVLEKQGIGIWKGNTSRSFLDANDLRHYNEGDVGPLYPFSLRHYNTPYNGCKYSYKGKGFDQWHNMIEGLKNDPYSRRHLMTTYNPSVTNQCVLPPCHGIAIQFYVEDKEDGVKGLRCHVYCRSSDVFLGLPFNIASYAVLTYIVAQLCDMKPLELIISTGDTHIYKNHIEQSEKQLQRKVLARSILKVNPRIKDKDISNVTIDDFELIGYFHHPPIHATMAI